MSQGGISEILGSFLPLGLSGKNEPKSRFLISFAYMIVLYQDLVLASGYMICTSFKRETRLILSSGPMVTPTSSAESHSLSYSN